MVRLGIADPQFLLWYLVGTMSSFSLVPHHSRSLLI